MTVIYNSAGPKEGLLAAAFRAATNVLTGKHASTVRMAGTALSIRVVGAAIAFGSQVVLARWLGSAEFGSYVYVWTWLLLAGDLVPLGLPLTAQRFIPEYGEAGSASLLRGYLSGSRWLTLGVSSAIALVGASVVWLARDALDPGLVTPLYLACVAIPAYSLTFMSDGVARSYNWTNIALLPAYVVRPLMLVAGVGALRLAGVHLDATKVMLVLVCASWLAALLQIVQLDRRLAPVVLKGPKHYETKKWLGTALPMVFVWGLYTLLTSTDVLLLKQFRPAEEVAHYFAAAKILALISMIYFAVAAASAHRFASYHVAKDKEGLAAFAVTTVGLTFWPSLAVCAFILLFGQPLLMLFGADFVSSYPVMFILSAGVLARASIGPAERVLSILGQQRKCAVAYGVAVTFNIVACLALAPAYGAIGAAAATAGAFAIESVLLFVIVKRALGVHMFVWAPTWPRQGHAAAAPNRAASQSGISVERFEGRLDEIESDWTDLVSRAHEPNVFMNPALVRAVGDPGSVTLLAWQATAGGRSLVGLSAFSVRRLPRSVVPAKVLMCPPGPHSYLATPVIDRSVAEPVLEAMLDFVAGDRGLPKLIVAEAMRTDGPTMQALRRVLDGRSSSAAVTAETQRPILASALDGKQYLEKALSGSSRKKLRQHRRRLEEMGTLETAVSDTPQSVRAAFDEFLALEHSGWKGAGGTSLLSDPADAAFARSMIDELGKRGDAVIHSLRLNGKPVSMQVVLRAGPAAFTWKTAYDESLRDFSPGTLLLEDYTRAFLSDRTIAWVDSCAIDSNSYMSAWTERETVAQVWINARAGHSLRFDILCRAQKAFLTMRGAAKARYLAWRGSWKRK